MPTDTLASSWQKSVTDATLATDGLRVRGDHAAVIDHRSTLSNAFVPYFKTLAEVRHDATVRMNASSVSGDEQSQQSWSTAMQQRSDVDDQLWALTSQALMLGLLPTVVTTLSLLDEKAESLWDKVNATALGEQVLSAALKVQRYYGLGHDVPDMVEQLADNAPFWSGWIASAHKERSIDDHLAEFLGDLIGVTTRHMNLLPACKTVFENVARIKGWDKRLSGWGYAGYTSGMKHGFIAFRSPQHDPLFEVAPEAFWIGASARVQVTSRLGGWIFHNFLRQAVQDPDGPVAQRLVLKAWLDLDKKTLLALDEALPAITQRHFPALMKLPVRSTSQGQPHLHQVCASLAVPHGRWAVSTFKSMGAPVNKEDLKYNGTMENWITADPTKILGIFTALSVKLEETELKKAFQSSEVPSILEPRRTHKRL